jgi:hypothetical protein
MRKLCCLLIAVASLLIVLRGVVSAQVVPAAAAAPPASTGTPSSAPVIPYDLDPEAFIEQPPKPLPTYTPAGSQVLFVVGDGGDNPTRGRFVSEVTRQLQSFYQLPHELVLVPEPTWSVSDYMNSCANLTANTKTRGALIVEIAAISNSSANWFWQKASWTELSGALLFSLCIQDHSKSSTGAGSSTAESTPNPLTPVSLKDITWQFAPKKGPLPSLQRIKYSTFNTPAPKPTPPPPYSMKWATHVYDQTGYTKNVTPLPVAGVVLALVSAGIPFVPSRTATGQDTITYPTPHPWLPGSPNGYVSSRQTTNTTTTNTQNETTLAAGFLSSSISYDQNLNALPSTTDDSSMRAVRSVVASFLKEMGCNLSDKSEPNYYGINLNNITVHGEMCFDLATESAPSSRPPAPIVPVISHARVITVDSWITNVRAPNSAYGCATPTPPPTATSSPVDKNTSQAALATPLPCGIEISAEIHNFTDRVSFPSPNAMSQPRNSNKGTINNQLAYTPLAIDLFRVRCKAYDQTGLVLYNEAAEPFGPLPLDPSDGADYEFYLSNVMTEKRDENDQVHKLARLQCNMSFRIGETWYDEMGLPSGHY